MKTSLLIVLGAALAVVIALAGFEFVSARRARAALERVNNQRAEKAEQLAVWRNKMAAAGKEEASLGDALKELQTSQPHYPVSLESGPRKEATPQRNGGRPDIAALLEKTPGLRAPYRQFRRADVAIRYLPLFDRLKLAPAQVEKFKDIMVEDEEERIDLQTTAAAGALASTDPTIAKLKQQQEMKLKAAQLELLGEDAYQEVERFNRVQPLESIMFGAANLISEDSSPMSAQHAQQLINVLAKANAPYLSGGTANQQTIDWPKVLVEAQSVLSPDEFTALKAEANIWKASQLVKAFFQQKTTAK